MSGDRFDIGVSHRRLLMLATLCIVLVTGFGVGLLTYAWRAVDAIEQRRETQLLQRAVDRNLARMGREVLSVTVWQEAFDRTLPPFDRAWTDENLGAYFSKSFGHDAAALFDPQGRLVYASTDGQMRAASTQAAFGQAVAPMAAHARAAELAHRFDARGRRRMGFADAVVVTGAVRSGGEIFLVAASPVTPEHTDHQDRRPASVVVTAQRIDGAYLASLKSDFGIEQARIVPIATQSTHVPLNDWRGRPVGALSWKLHRPGVAVLSKVSAPVAAILLMLVVLVVAIMSRVGAILNRLKAKDEALAHSLEDLAKAHEKAKAASDAKSQFLANMSHEIRTPLNGVLGMAQVMAADPLDPKQQERVQIIRSSGERLLLILNDILDLSRIETGQVELVESEFDLERLLQESCAMFTVQAQEKDLVLEIHCAREACGHWFGDRLRVGQIVANLVSNGLKFTSAGRVRVEASQIGHELQISVRDTGVGMCPDALDGLFSKFSQVDNSDTRQFGGAGLGLAIIQQLITRMGGDIRVESAPGVGSCFTVRLPLIRPVATARIEPDPACAHEAAELQPSLRVLAVEDNPVNRMLLAALLEPLDLQIDMVEDGAEAVEAFAPGKYDLVLMDVQMPVMDGVTATRRIRACEAANPEAPRTPVIMLTANVMSHQLQGYTDAGADGCVAKPIRLPELIEAMETALGGEEAPGQTAAA